MGKKVEAQKEVLLEMLQNTDFVPVSAVAEHLNVSLPTARRLCMALSQEGLALRVHGGIKPTEGGKSAYSYDQLKNDHIEEKKRIAEYASRMVQNGQVVFVEAGTTLSYFSHALAQRIQNHELNNVIVFTNSLINLDIFNAIHHSIVLVGGQYRNERKDFVGYLSELSINNLQFNYAFIGADAISLNSGIMAMDVDTVRFDAHLVSRSDRVVILAHAEKFNRNSLISYMPTEKVNTIVTDSAITAETLEEYKHRGIHVVAV